MIICTVLSTIGIAAIIAVGARLIHKAGDSARNKEK